MSDELIIHFDTPAQFKVRYDSDETELLPFHSPINDAEYQDIRWYLEKYATDYTSEPDDERAARIAEMLPTWGVALFNAVFTDPTAKRFFDRLQVSDESERYITLSSVLPEILSLPWEVLKDPHGVYLFNENPRIAIRRSFKSQGGRPARKVKTKKTLHLLFIVSRPEGAGFIDPRMEAKTILHALQVQNIQVEVEFLRRATLATLIERLENTELPPVDIVHFDGHGAFDSAGGLACRSTDSTEAKKDQTATKNMGYLLFEDEQGKKDLVSADTLGEMLHQQQVSMMVLSACQSAQVAGEDAMGSVAARLVHAGIPSVLAMTHSVLVVTTELLFKKFYEEIAKGHRIGEALENARRTLFRETTRHTKRFGEREVVVKLQDWFIPSLYQTGGDVPLLKRSEEKLPTVAPLHNVPALQEVGFFGRARELWELEQWLLRGTRRVTISGFGGQGKTYLASELARWLLQKHWFERAVFVSYHGFQYVDAVDLAVIRFAEVCQVSLLNADAVTAQLSQHPTLLILDNVESVTGTELQKLLTVAAQWSEVGETRLLVTTRPEIVLHSAFPTAHSERHRLLHLAGLRADDAVNYLQRLLRLPPETKVRAKYDDLVRLLWVVRNHPLSIPMIAQALRTQRLETVETRLRELTVASPDNPVVASLQLSLEKLDAEVQQWLPLLGVFEGGALQSMLEKITELSREQLSKLQSALFTTGLIHPIPIAEGYIYLQFHPTLAPVLWSRLDPTQQATLRQRYQQHYYQLSQALVHGDERNPLVARAIVKQELSNLLAAVKGALADGSDEAVDFVNEVNRFLGYFGLQRDRAVLTQQAATLAGVRGSDSWYLSKTNQGQQLFDNGQYATAAILFTELLETLSAVSEQRCLTLHRLGRCLSFQGQTAEAITYYQQELVELEQLTPSDSVVRQKGVFHTDLADALTDSGQFEPAKQHYEQSLAIDKQTGDQRGEAVINGQLGRLAWMQGDLAEAEQRHQTALELFQQLDEPLGEATAWHQLGYVYQAAQQWDAAETAYRRAAHLCEAQGQLQRAAQTWNNLAMVTESMGKWTEAEAWYRKAIEGFQAAGDSKNRATGLNNLAHLLQNQPERLTEARQLAEQALDIDKTLDPAAAGIWTTYYNLAQIAEKQGDVAAAKAYRRLSREAKMNFAGTRYELEREHRDFILGVIAAVTDAEVRQGLETALDGASEEWKNLAQAIRQILAGERDAEVLCEPLDFDDAPIVVAILAGLAG